MPINELILVICVVALAFWRNQLFLNIVAMITLILFSALWSETSVYYAIPLWLLVIYILLKSISGMMESRRS